MSNFATPSICARCVRNLERKGAHQFRRAFTSTAHQRLQEQETNIPEQTPRWKRTPPRMQMPYRLRDLPNQPLWKVNDKEEPLNRMYDSFLGNKVRGRDMLPEEIKWLAVTHKSFDHARRGFNDRLAFLGKRIVDLQTSLALLAAPNELSSQTSKHTALGAIYGEGDDEVFQHPALEGAENVTNMAKHSILDRSRLANLARSYGIDKVVRWKPRKADGLEASGVDTVLAHTIYSIIGALALHRGGELAASVTRDRVLHPLGLR